MTIVSATTFTGTDSITGPSIQTEMVCPVTRLSQGTPPVPAC